MHFHAIVWMDHHRAHVLGFGEGEPSRKLIKNEGPERIHHKAGSIGSGHVHDGAHYFAAIADALAGFHEILIVGPAEAKTEFLAYLRERHRDVAKKILDVVPMDQSSEAEIIAHGRRFFSHADRMTPQR